MYNHAVVSLSTLVLVNIAIDGEAYDYSYHDTNDYIVFVLFKKFFCGGSFGFAFRSIYFEFFFLLNNLLPYWSSLILDSIVPILEGKCCFLRIQSWHHRYSQTLSIFYHKLRFFVRIWPNLRFFSITCNIQRHPLIHLRKRNIYTATFISTSRIQDLIGANRIRSWLDTLVIVYKSSIANGLLLPRCVDIQAIIAICDSTGSCLLFWTHRIIFTFTYRILFGAFVISFWAISLSGALRAAFNIPDGLGFTRVEAEVIAATSAGMAGIRGVLWLG